MVQRAARRALREEMPRRVAEAEAAGADAFSLSSDHRILWDASPIANLRPGASVLRPRVEILDSEFLDGAQRERLRGRLQRWMDDAVRADLAPLFEATDRAARTSLLRGTLHRLQGALGIIAGTDEGGDNEIRRALKTVGVTAGRFALFLPALLKPRAAMMRARLWALGRGLPMPETPAPGAVSMTPPPAWPTGFAEAMGWLDAGPHLIRLDIAERVAAELAWAARRGGIALPAGLASRFAVPRAALPMVLHRLGFRLIPGGSLAADVYGPPTPPILLAPHRRRATQAAEPIRPPRLTQGPFAALAALRR